MAGLAPRLGKGEFYWMGSPRPGHDDAPHPGTGADALDQSWHVGWLFVAALIATIGPRLEALVEEAVRAVFRASLDRINRDP
jgi:hypothetical protein